MYLSAMVGLMLKEVAQHIFHAFSLNASVALKLHRRGKFLGCQPFVDCNKALVDLRLLFGERCQVIEGFFNIEGAKAEGSPFQPIDLEPVDWECVVQRRFDRREKACARGFEFAGFKGRAGG
jgi:ssDNA-binding Zn-finger/Zn-ribbon topoisomerase 1